MNVSGSTEYLWRSIVIDDAVDMSQILAKRMSPRLNNRGQDRRDDRAKLHGDTNDYRFEY